MADGKVEIGLELNDKEARSKASKSGEDIGSDFAGSLNKGLKGLAGKLAGLVAVSEVARSFADLSKQALDAYSEYEQLAGGVAKIFDEADQSAILADANRAYLDLNMSANDYLAVINQTGAAFASTMGDQQGYDTARKGMLAISDYASGTGRNLDELSEKFALITRSTGSYQSIADQFSGILPATSAGFLEQAQAAGILSSEYKKLTDVPIDEYQRAVTDMLSLGVEQMGLAGNTAAETASTVSGSLAAVTAQWQNWLVAVADGSADIDAATAVLVDAVEVAASNVVPVLGQILSTLKDQLVKALKELVDALLHNSPEIQATAYEMFWKLVEALEEIVPLLIAALGMMVVLAIQVLIQAAAEFFSQGLNLAKKVADGVGSAAGSVKDQFVAGVRDAVNAVKAWASDFFSAGRNLVDGIVNGIKSGVSRIKDAVVNAAKGALDAAKNALGIASPSKEFFKVGEWSVEGWGQGFRKRGAALMSTVSDVAHGMLDAARPRSLSYVGGSSVTNNYSFGDVNLNASDAYGITAIEQLIDIIETA